MKAMLQQHHDHLFLPFNGRRLWQGFWQLADPKIWIASTVPMLVAVALAYAKTGSLDWGWLAIAFVGVYLIEIGKNAVNEFFDFLSGADRYVVGDQRTPFSGGKKTIIQGKLSLFETGVIAVVTLFAAFLIGVYIALYCEPRIFWIGMAGGIIAIAYTFPPFKLCYRGLGEIFIGIAFGPLIVSGMYLMLTHTWSWEIALIGLPVAFLIMNVIWINQYPDYQADLKAGKRNWVVRLGPERGVKVYAWFYAAAYASAVILAVVSRNPLWLLVLATIPWAVQTVRIARRHARNIPQLTAANAKTVQIYQVVGLAMIIASLFQI